MQSYNCSTPTGAYSSGQSASEFPPQYTRAEIPYKQYEYPTLWYPHVSDTPLTFDLFFLGKACLDTRIRQLNPEFYDPV